LASPIKTLKMIFIQNIAYFFSIFLGGLISGLLFSFACSVNLGLKSLGDIEYIKAMQSINTAIQNPYFLISFTSLLLVLPISTYLHFRPETDTSFYYMLAATLIYFIGVFGITMYYNVPLNEQLAKFNSLTRTTIEISSIRQSFEKNWNYYHIIRTIASIISFGLTILAIIKSKF
jgi:uncharacterized membrane protein